MGCVLIHAQKSQTLWRHRKPTFHAPKLMKIKIQGLHIDGNYKSVVKIIALLFFSCNSDASVKELHRSLADWTKMMNNGFQSVVQNSKAIHFILV